MPVNPNRLMTLVAAPLALAACAVTGPAPAGQSYGALNGVLASNAPVLFVPVGTDERGCTQYTKKPLRDGIMVDTGIWYRTADDQFVLDANRCVPDDLAPAKEKPQ